jgi:hypothetical protein
MSNEQTLSKETSMNLVSSKSYWCLGAGSVFSFLWAGELKRLSTQGLLIIYCVCLIVSMPCHPWNKIELES